MEKYVWDVSWWGIGAEGVYSEETHHMQSHGDKPHCYKHYPPVDSNTTIYRWVISLANL